MWRLGTLIVLFYVLMKRAFVSVIENIYICGKFKNYGL